MAGLAGAVAFALAVAAMPAAGVAEEVWQEVSVSAADAARLLAHGADFEGMKRRDGRILYYAEASQVARWSAQGFEVRIEDSDVAATYAARLAVPAAMREFANGSMGGFFTLSEVQARMSGYRKINPAVMSTKTAIGTSVEGRISVTGGGSFKLPALNTFASTSRSVKVRGGTVPSWGEAPIVVEYSDSRAGVTRREQVQVEVGPAQAAR